MWARKKCSILTHEIYTGHCPKIKYQIVPKMRFRDIFEAVSTAKAYLFAGRPCEWDSCSFCSFCRNIGGVGKMLVVGWRAKHCTRDPFQPLLLRLCVGLSMDICLVNLVLERALWVIESCLTSVTTGIPSKGAHTVSFWGDSARCRCPAVPAQSPLSYSRADWPTVLGGCT